MDLSVVILTFNSQSFISDCIKSLIASKGISFDSKPKSKYLGEIIVVDNASRDGTCEEIVSKFPFVKLLKNRSNDGFAKGNNIGLKIAKGRYSLLLNADSFVEKDTLEKMIDFMDNNPKVGISTCFVELVKTKEIDWASHRGFPTPWASLTFFLGLEKLFPKVKFFSSYHQTYKDLKTTHEIDSPVGAFYLIRAEVLKNIGLLDEDYFMYAEDLDLSFRAKEKGWKVMYVPDVKVYHYKGMSSGLKAHSANEASATNEEREKAFNAFYDTMKLFYAKHYLKKYPIWLKWLVFAGIDFKKLLSKVKKTV